MDGISSFDPETIDVLPRQVPVFPLADFLLLPGGRLPLMIFEPRYIAMVQFALQYSRYIGLVRPLAAETERNLAPSNGPALCRVGCLGRIVLFEELADGRFRIELRGIIRFNLLSDSISGGGFRAANIDMSPYVGDLNNRFVMPDRAYFVGRLKEYVQARNLSVDWQKIEKIPDESLLVTLAQSVPFSVKERQGLLECPTKKELHDMLQAIFELAVARRSNDLKVN